MKFSTKLKRKMKNKLFYYDLNVRTEYTYSGLFYFLNSSTEICKIIHSIDYFEIFRNIILSLIYDIPVTLIDHDLSQKEISNFGINYHEINDIIKLDQKIAVDINNLLPLIYSNKNWQITLFTSGTTGMPKKISHSFTALTRAVRTGGNKSNDIWGLAYNPTHMAGLQVFFQALLNLNSIVRLFGFSRSDIYSLIEDYSITNISATPTFYRLILPYENKFNSVKYITSGGEKFDHKLSEDIALIFPAAKLLNIYASTEAGTIFASVNDLFILKNEYCAFVKIDDLELCIHQDLLGKSDSLIFEDGWYRTGDLVEIIKSEPLTFRIISRKNELINVGGYKVNPTEVELSLNSHPGVALSRVYARKNSVTGNIVIAEVKKKEPMLEEKALRLFLSERLQSFKIPRIINFVESIDTTYTGKLKRL